MLLVEFGHPRIRLAFLLFELLAQLVNFLLFFVQGLSHLCHFSLKVRYFCLTLFFKFLDLPEELLEVLHDLLFDHSVEESAHVSLCLETDLFYLLSQLKSLLLELLRLVFHAAGGYKGVANIVKFRQFVLSFLLMLFDLLLDRWLFSSSDDL